MAFALVTCPNCKKMLDFSNAGMMREKYGPKIGEERYVICFHCGTRIQVQSEWDKMPVAQKVTYAGRGLVALIGGGFFTYLFFFSLLSKGGHIEIPMILIGLSFGVGPMIFGAIDLMKISESKNRTSKDR